MNSPPNFSFKRSAVCLWYHYSTQLWICLDRKRGVTKVFPSRVRIYNRKKIARFWTSLTLFSKLLHFFTKKSSILSHIFGAERQKCIKRVKNVKNVLDKRKISWYNSASRFERWIFITVPKKISKKLKNFQKRYWQSVLDVI